MSNTPVTYEERIAAAQAKMNAFNEKMAAVSEKVKKAHTIKKQRLPKQSTLSTPIRTSWMPRSSRIITRTWLRSTRISKRSKPLSSMM